MRQYLLSAAILAGLSVTSGLAHAQQVSTEEVALLRAQIEQLQQRLDALEQRAAAEQQVAAAAVPAPAPTPAPAAPAAQVRTEGGLRVTSADGEYAFRLGGRIHIDGYWFDSDQPNVFSSTEIRRARLSLQGSLRQWDYRVDHEFTSDGNLGGFREVSISRAVGDHRFSIGHLKPLRGMDELTSSAEIITLERSGVSSSGLFNGRQFQQGLNWQWADADRGMTAGLSLFNLRNAAGPRNEGYGVSGRLTWAALNEDERTVHLGGWFSHESIGENAYDIIAVSNYAGRRGPRQIMAVTIEESKGNVDAVGLEVGASIGPWYVQSEYARAWFDQTVGSAVRLDSYYLQGAWLLNGGHRQYRGGTGVFGAPTGVENGGLWELVARHEQMHNRDIEGLRTRSNVLGVNYYINQHMRLMMDYTRGKDVLTDSKTSRVGVRTQIVF